MPQERTGQAGGEGRRAKPGAQQETPVDLSALKGLNANGKLHVGALQVRGLKLADVRAEVKAANGRADIAPHSANLYEGKVAGALSLQADGNRITLKEDLTRRRRSARCSRTSRRRTCSRAAATSRSTSTPPARRSRR